MTEDAAPLLVLAAGQRCGSTLIQRLLCSHPRVLIWGEHAGQLRPVLAANERLRLWTETNGMAARNELAANGYQGFLANLTPERGVVDDAFFTFIETLFAKPAREVGRPIWGFKEVSYGLSDVLLLREFFPRLRVIQLVRDPRDVLRSLDEWERTGGWERVNTAAALRHWLDVARSFVGTATDPHLRSFTLSIRYEDLIQFSHAWTKAIAEHCALEADLLDESVFEHWVHAAGPRGRADRQLREWSDLPASLRAIVDDEELQMVASAYGYDLAGSCT
jgi:sulfotransferase family protein